MLYSAIGQVCSCYDWQSVSGAFRDRWFMFRGAGRLTGSVSGAFRDRWFMFRGAGRLTGSVSGAFRDRWFMFRGTVGLCLGGPLVYV